MFVYSDTPVTPMEVAYACVFDPSTASGGYSFEHVRAVLADRIPGLVPFRRRLVTVPLGLDHPRWVDDPGFDLDNHLRRAAAPFPGGPAELQAMVAAVMGRPLDPQRPPWEMHVIEGLEGGRVGLIAKVHHSVIDGVAGVQLMAQLFDFTAEGRPMADDHAPWVPPALPTRVQMVGHALPSVLTSPFRAIGAAREVGRTAVRLARRALDEAAGPLSIPLGAPTTFETPVGASRSVSFAELSLREVRQIKDRFGVTVNDVILAACSGALRTHLAERGHLVQGDGKDGKADGPLVAVVPVSVRNPDGGNELGNRLSAMFVSLANDLAHPLDRLHAIAASSASAKAQERAVGYGPMASAVAEAVPPALARPVIRLGLQMGALRRLRAGNLMISNVPGPDFALYFAGMRLVAAYPLGPVIDGVALNVTVQSYRESLFVGINASTSAVPDLPALAASIVDELAHLLAAAADTYDRMGSIERAARRTRPAGMQHVA
jgi:diacylglycerol O-acyltransferase / wax synthase